MSCVCPVFNMQIFDNGVLPDKKIRNSSWIIEVDIQKALEKSFVRVKITGKIQCSLILFHHYFYQYLNPI
jgi:hypothetical protein